ncbi:hypothetical protein CC2G_012247 [Coprinopsis cinerea AmutBmut pab1-1]|nr:hypothetical protein CC2G_012247 [Coprinopsis cinerea AmutBmut pab1-1]
MRWGIAIFLHFTFTLVDATKWQIGSIVRIKPIQSLNPTESLVKFVLPPGNSGRSTPKFPFPTPSRGYARRQRLSQHERYVTSYPTWKGKEREAATGTLKS